jgi:hypothetical protein
MPRPGARVAGPALTGQGNKSLTPSGLKCDEAPPRGDRDGASSTRVVTGKASAKGRLPGLRARQTTSLTWPDMVTIPFGRCLRS